MTANATTYMPMGITEAPHKSEFMKVLEATIEVTPKQLGCIVGIWNMWLTQGPQMLRELAGHPFGITKRPARKCGNSDVVGHHAQQIQGFRTSGDPEVIQLGILRISPGKSACRK